MNLALKVVRWGSVGVRCYIALFVVLITGAMTTIRCSSNSKGAGAWALETYPAQGRLAAPCHRVVAGQRLIPASSDLFLGGTPGRDAQRGR